MPIKWSTLKVTEAVDLAERHLAEAAVPLAQARIVAKEALDIPHIPQYVDQHFRALRDDLDQLGSRLRERLERIRQSLPKQAMQAEQKRADQGNTLSLL